MFLSVVYWNSNLPDNEKSVKEGVVRGERRMLIVGVWVNLKGSGDWCRLDIEETCTL